MAEVVFTVILVIIFSCCLTMIGWNFWCVRCNNKTYKQRMFLINLRALAEFLRG